MYYDIVKSTYETETVRIDLQLIYGGYDNEEEACAKARELIINNELKENEFYEVEEHDDDGNLLMIIEP